MVWNDSNYNTVSGVFNSDHKVEKVLNELDSRGIGTDLVDIIMSDNTRNRYGNSEITDTIEKDNKLPEGLSVGGLSGGLLGGILGGLTMAGSLLIPGLNLLIAGPIVGAIAGGALGTATGGLVGALVGAGIPEYEAKTYEKELQNEGSVLLVAHVIADEVDEVKAIFKRNGSADTDVRPDLSEASPVTSNY